MRENEIPAVAFTWDAQSAGWKMKTTEIRLREAQRELHYLVLRVEQYRLHVHELGGHPGQSAQARQVLENMQVELERQRRYCDLLEKAFARTSHKDGSSSIA